MIFLIDKANLLRSDEEKAQSRLNEGIQDTGNNGQHCKTILNFWVCGSVVEMHFPILNTSTGAGKNLAMPLSLNRFTCADNSSPQIAFFPKQWMGRKKWEHRKNEGSNCLTETLINKHTNFFKWSTTT